MKGALTAGTVLSLLAVGAWSVTAAATIGDVPPGTLGFWRHPSPRSYLALAAGPGGNGWELCAALSVIYMLCLLVHGARQHRRLLWQQQDQRGGEGDGSPAPLPRKERI